MADFVVIPMYNESSTIRDVAKKAKKYANVILVDDGSTDDTLKVIQKIKGVHILSHKINLGKGAALKTGYDYALKLGATKILMMDSDGQHNPKDVPKFLKALEEYDAVFGSRCEKKEMPAVLHIGNWGLSRLTNFLFKVNVRDSQCGFRGFTSEAYKKIRWRISGFAADNEMIASVGAKGLSYTEVPIGTVYLDRYKGTTVVSGIKLAINMVLMKLRWY